MLNVLHVPLASLIFLLLTVWKGERLIILQHLHPRPWHFFSPPLTVPSAWCFKALTWLLMLGATFLTKANNFPPIVRKLGVRLNDSSQPRIALTVASSALKVEITRIRSSSFSLFSFTAMFRGRMRLKCSNNT